MKKINWRYAIGELLIVIAGISVAFALNNWAGNIQNENQANAYLKSLAADIEHDINLLDSNLAELQSRQQYLQKLIPHLRQKMPGRDTIIFPLFKVVDPVRFRPLETTIQSMKYSGDIKLIEDLNLRNKIVEHYENYGITEDEYERHRTFAQNYIAPYFMTEIDYSALRTEEGFGFMEDKYFHNLVYSLLGVINLQIKVQSQAQGAALEMKKMLNDVE